MTYLTKDDLHFVNKKYNITVDIKNVYGNELIYPVCDNAKRFTNLTGTKTLRKKDIYIIKSLGFNIVVNTQKITLTNGWTMAVKEKTL